jgi:serine/threonine protein kinase
LNHPNIAGIYDVQEAQGARFLILELVDGETLADRIARGPIPVREALSIATQMCEALEAAHEKGIVRRDLKPSNVKVTPEGKVKVLDFDLACNFFRSNRTAYTVATPCRPVRVLIIPRPARAAHNPRRQKRPRLKSMWSSTGLRNFRNVFR